MAADDPKNEGEGSRTAAAEYNKKTQEFVEKGEVEKQAEEAVKALDSAEADALRKAEEEGRSRARGEDPQVHRDT
jgi:hypothetical protein